MQKRGGGGICGENPYAACVQGEEVKGRQSGKSGGSGLAAAGSQTQDVEKGSLPPKRRQRQPCSAHMMEGIV